TIALNTHRDAFLIDLPLQPVDAPHKFYFNLQLK
ncbi:hypothetical protein, partial [Bacillus subtilis]